MKTEVASEVESIGQIDLSGTNAFVQKLLNDA
jgi:hypothetical protein